MRTSLMTINFNMFTEKETDVNNITLEKMESLNYKYIQTNVKLNLLI